jgi:hypothetical protein
MYLIFPLKRERERERERERAERVDRRGRRRRKREKVNSSKVNDVFLKHIHNTVFRFYVLFCVPSFVF